ncbi:MAG: hypothetical protein IPG89_05270 [Bacteroidetes bacterium]|nr:hypothetical protein [Bacteroidota bacterium]
MKKSFVWNGSSWSIIAQDGNDGSQGIQGQQGPIGNQGPVGVSLNWLGNLNVAPTLPNLNDAYYNTVLKKSFVWNGTSWTIIAQDGNDGQQGMQGQQGLQGPIGNQGKMN